MKQTIKSATQEQLNSVLTLLRVIRCWFYCSLFEITKQLSFVETYEHFRNFKHKWTANCKYAEYEYVTMCL